MLTSSDELRDKMVARFGDIDAFGPQEALRSAGYTLNRDWTWTPPPVVSDYRDMREEDYECLLFLVDEWDYGGLEAPRVIPTVQRSTNPGETS